MYFSRSCNLIRIDIEEAQKNLKINMDYANPDSAKDFVKDPLQDLDCLGKFPVAKLFSQTNIYFISILPVVPTPTSLSQTPDRVYKFPKKPEKLLKINIK